jgi:hypothetical protein
MTTWTDDQLRAARNLVAIADKYKTVPRLLLLAVCAQESSFNDSAEGDVSLGGSFGPFQLYSGAHQAAAVLGLDPWYDYGFPEIMARWAQSYAAVGGDTAWAVIGDRAGICEQFAPQAQGSIAWPAGLGAQRYADALSILEAVS